jgi:hypothetical protein
LRWANRAVKTLSSKLALQSFVDAVTARTGERKVRANARRVSCQSAEQESVRDR